MAVLLTRLPPKPLSDEALDEWRYEPPRTGDGVQIDGDKKEYIVGRVVHIYSRDQHGRMRHVADHVELKEIPNG